MTKHPVLTIFVPEKCAKCHSETDAEHYKYTLVGTEARCVWLCNSCFTRLYTESHEPVKPKRK